jgi:hypothetical protein
MAACEDYPCCGHEWGDCDYRGLSKDDYLAKPWLLHEPGSPEWYDAIDEMEGGSDE